MKKIFRPRYSRTRSNRVRLALLGLAIAFGPAPSSANDTIRIGLLPDSAMHWELDVIRHNKLDAKHGIHIGVVPQTSVQTARSALASGAVDIISGDWFWVSRQRAAGRYYTLVPFLTAASAAMASPDSTVASLSAMKALDISHVDGALAPQWLLLKAQHQSIHKSHAAPVTLRTSRDADVHLVDWRTATRLEVEGYRRISATDTIASDLGAEGRMPETGYVFHEEWPRGNRRAAIGFVRASREAKRILKSSDDEWARIRPLMNAADDRVFALLKERFRNGIPGRTISDELADAEDIHILLGPLAAEHDVNLGAAISPGTFWRGHPDNP